MNFFIDGEWVESKTRRVMDVINPATGEVIDTVPVGSADDAERAVCSAEEAFKKWRRVSMAERTAIQHKAAAAMRDQVDGLARMLTLELGRPLAGSQQEIMRSADLLDYFAEEGLRLRGEIPMLNEDDERVLVVKEPVGVVIAITPFNYPITLLAFKLGPALITGCALVCKPAEDTPLTTLMLAQLFHSAGYPPGVFNVVTGYGGELGQALVSHPVPRKVAFTGSTNAGKRIASIAAETAKRLTLEMGGQCPAIICDDADLDVAVPALVKHAFANSGQFCYRVNRLYVGRGIYDPFVARFSEEAAKLRVGNGMDPHSQLGPMINEKICANSERHVRDGIDRGARVLTGGQRLTGGGYDSGHFFPPTVLADADHSMLIMTEETFGPVVGIMPFDDLDEAITLANDTRYGLAAYVFSENMATGLKTAEQLEAGSVWVNNIHRSYNMVPFGGMKESGIGREKSAHGLEAYLELKTIYLAIS